MRGKGPSRLLEYWDVMSAEPVALIPSGDTLLSFLSSHKGGEELKNQTCNPAKFGRFFHRSEFPGRMERIKIK